MDYRSALIYRERMRRNWSQSGLCKGICAVSYLSKIETGKAEPSEEVLRLLLERLGLILSPALEQEARSKADTAWELLFTGEHAALDRLLSPQDADRFRATSAGLDFLLLNAWRRDPAPLAAEMEPCMNGRQLALQRCLQGKEEEAYRLCPNAFFALRRGSAAYAAGRYTQALEALQSAYDLAAREGAARLMFWARTLMGNCHCNQGNLSLMRAHYAVARRLGAALGEREDLSAMDYNLHAALMETGEYETPYAYFSSLADPGAMALHKLAICCEKLGKKQEALGALDRADKMACPEMPDGLALQCRALVRYRLEHPDYLEQEEYGSTLIQCFDDLRRCLPQGYAHFHLPWVLEWLTAGRQYKRAYELLRDFPESND